MPLCVVSFATYLTDINVQWRPEDYDAYKFIKAIKGDQINKYAEVPVCGRTYTLQQSNAHEAIEWFGDMVAEQLTKMKPLPHPLALVPIPNSSCAVTNSREPRTLRLAEAVAARIAAEVWDGLRWREPMVSSKAGGTRDPQELYQHLVITKPLPLAKIVLVDDVRTTGAHVRAARALLENKGGECVLGVCAGRTPLGQEPSAFSVLEEDLEDFAPR